MEAIAPIRESVSSDKWQRRVWMKNNSYFWQTMINKTGSNGIVHRLNRKKSTVPASLLIHSDQQDFCYADSADRNLSLRDE